MHCRPAQGKARKGKRKNEETPIEDKYEDDILKENGKSGPKKLRHLLPVKTKEGVIESRVVEEDEVEEKDDEPEEAENNVEEEESENSDTEVISELTSEVYSLISIFLIYTHQRDASTVITCLVWCTSLVLELA